MPDTATQFNFKPAKREGVGVFVGLAGGTGSGKTFSALTLATGIAGPDGKIAAGDTEGKRMSHYATRFKFDVVDLLPPFRPEKFETLAKNAEAKGYRVLIIDSFSHEWAGDGGVLEWHDEIMDGHENKNMMAWIKPKAAHKAMVNSFLQRNKLAVIFCMRAEEKIKVLPGGKPEPMGWMPICDKNFQFELTTMITLSNERPGIVDYKLPRKIEIDHLGFFPDGKLITAEAGAKLAAWARGEDAPAPAQKIDRTSQTVDTLVKRLAAVKDDPVAFEAILKEPLVVRQTEWMKTNRTDQSTRLDEEIKKLTTPSPSMTDADDGKAEASIPTS